MAPDLTNISNMNYHIITDDGKELTLKGVTEISYDDDNIHTYCGDIDSSVFEETTGTIQFNVSKKQWYKIQKSLGLVIPIYKRKKKGKRYVWKEIIE